MCRYARDLMPMFKLLAGSKKSVELHLDDQVDVKKLKIYYLTDDGWKWNPVASPVHEDLKQAQQKLVRNIKDSLGITCKQVQIKDLFHAYSLFTHGMSSEPTAPPFSAELTECNGEINPLWEMLKWLFGQSAHTLPAIFLAKESTRFGPDHPKFHQRLQMIEDLKNEIEALLGEIMIITEM